MSLSSMSLQRKNLLNKRSDTSLRPEMTRTEILLRFGCSGFPSAADSVPNVLFYLRCLFFILPGSRWFQLVSRTAGATCTDTTCSAAEILQSSAPAARRLETSAKHTRHYLQSLVSVLKYGPNVCKVNVGRGTFLAVWSAKESSATMYCREGGEGSGGL